MTGYISYRSPNEDWFNAISRFMGFAVVGAFAVAVSKSVIERMTPKEEKFLPATVESAEGKTLRFATETRVITGTTLKRWQRQGRAYLLQPGGFYGAEGLKPKLWVVDNTIYQLDPIIGYHWTFLPARKEDLAQKTIERLAKEQRLPPAVSGGGSGEVVDILKEAAYR
ncbi:hypothetical protein M1N86_01310 [Dehalococcoidia bacterium]|nr:hypothetical protein [Dehalococcoidia bacterium]MCL0087986.1 hypothetical protein [Dehalococcoidia bacterium]